MSSTDDIVLHTIPVNYQQQTVNPNQFQGVQPQIFVIQQPKQVATQTKSDPTPAKSTSPTVPNENRGLSVFWVVTGVLVSLLGLMWFEGYINRLKQTFYNQGYQAAIESAQSQIQQANADKQAAIANLQAAQAETAGYKASLQQIQAVIEQQQKPLLQLGLINN